MGDPARTMVHAGRYEIRLQGSVGWEALDGFEEFEGGVGPADTILHGTMPDQAALHRVLAQIDALGLELVGVRRLPDGE
jgi:hypothetical protein